MLKAQDSESLNLEKPKAKKKNFNKKKQQKILAKKISRKILREIIDEIFISLTQKKSLENIELESHEQRRSASPKIFLTEEGIDNATEGEEITISLTDGSQSLDTSFSQPEIYSRKSMHIQEDSEKLLQNLIVSPIVSTCNKSKAEDYCSQAKDDPLSEAGLQERKQQLTEEKKEEGS